MLLYVSKMFKKITEMWCIYDDDDALIVKEREEKEEIKKVKYLSYISV